jgi:hypothetical protein
MTWWVSTPMIEFVLFACLTGAAASWSARAAGGRSRLLRLAATGYLSACAFCCFYPPVWAPMLWVICALAIDAHRRAIKGAIVAIATIAAGAAVGVYYHLPYLALVIDTAYPGRRVATAGDLRLSRLADLIWPSLTISAPVRCGKPVYLGPEITNVCEASAIEAVPLLLLASLALASPRVRRAFAALFRQRPATIAAAILLGAWIFAPLPTWLGTPTLLRWSMGIRAWIAFSLACALIAAGVLAELAADEGKEPRSRAVIAVGSLALAGSAFIAWRHVSTALVTGCVARAWWPPMILAAVLMLASLWWMGGPRGAAWLLAGWVAPIALANFSVNPMIWTRHLFTRGVGHEVIDRALEAEPGRIADFSTHPAATLSAFGWPMLTGVEVAPDLALFRFLEPETHLGESIYNRYAHVGFVLPPAPSVLQNGDWFKASISPCSTRLAALWVNHFLAPADAALPAECAGEFTVREPGELRLWSRKAPVCRFGVARGNPASALDFDWSCGAAGEARFEPGLAGFNLSVPPDPSRSWAMAFNTGVIERIDCDGATARVVDTHVVVRPDGSPQATCRARYLGSWGALQRLLHRGA